MRCSAVLIALSCAGIARAGLVIPQGIVEQPVPPPIYSVEDGGTVGAAAFPVAQRYFDALSGFSAPGGPFDVVVSGTLTHFRPNRPSPNDYAAEGAYAYLNVTSDVFVATSDGLGYLFTAPALATATSRVDDGLPADLGPTYGGGFKVTLDGTASDLARRAGGTLVVRISASGSAGPLGGSQVVADLSYSVAIVPVPEPATLVSCGTAALMLLGYARRRWAARA